MTLTSLEVLRLKCKLKFVMELFLSQKLINEHVPIHMPLCAKRLQRIHDWPVFCSAIERFHMTLPGPPYWCPKTMFTLTPAFLRKIQ